MQMHFVCMTKRGVKGNIAHMACWNRVDHFITLFRIDVGISQTTSFILFGCSAITLCSVQCSIQDMSWDSWCVVLLALYNSKLSLYSKSFLLCCLLLLLNLCSLMLSVPLLGVLPMLYVTVNSKRGILHSNWKRRAGR